MEEKKTLMSQIPDRHFALLFWSGQYNESNALVSLFPSCNYRSFLYANFTCSFVTIQCQAASTGYIGKGPNVAKPVP